MSRVTPPTASKLGKSTIHSVIGDPLAVSRWTLAAGRDPPEKQGDNCLKPALKILGLYTLRLSSSFEIS